MDAAQVIEKAVADARAAGRRIKGSATLQLLAAVGTGFAAGVLLRVLENRDGTPKNARQRE